MSIREQTAEVFGADGSGGEAPDADSNPSTGGGRGRGGGWGRIVVGPLIGAVAVVIAAAIGIQAGNVSVVVNDDSDMDRAVEGIENLRGDVEKLRQELAT